MVMLSLLLLIPIYAASFFFMRTEASALFWLLAMTIPTTMFGVSNLPMYAELLPQAQYGQFCSAQALVNSLFLLAGNWLCGQYLDRVKDYRHSFTWSLMFFALSLLAMLKVYAGWKTHGGADHYRAPA
jgi:MFS-type transporter involved in bile tolerance (Atg22 family)